MKEPSFKQSMLLLCAPLTRITRHIFNPAQLIIPGYPGFIEAFKHFIATTFNSTNNKLSRQYVVVKKRDINDLLK